MMRFKDTKLIKEKWDDFQKTRGELRNHILEMTNVVVITISNAGNVKLYSAFMPDLIIMDEVAGLYEYPSLTQEPDRLTDRDLDY